MLQQANDDFTPDRERAADADASVPIIDIAAFANGDAGRRRNVVDAVKQACERVGFFVITGHQVPDAKAAISIVGTEAFASATRSRSGAKPSFTCCNMIVSCLWPEAAHSAACQ